MMEQLSQERWMTMGMVPIPSPSPLRLLLTSSSSQWMVNTCPCDLDVRRHRQYNTLCDPDQVIHCSGGPSGIAIHDSRDIYVTCYIKNSIAVFDQAGQQKRTIGSSGSGDGQFSYPYGLFIKGDVMLC